MKSFRCAARCLAALSVFALVLAGARDAEAGSNLFERSYYSHAPAKPVQIGTHRGPPGGPMFTKPQGVAATGGIRWNYSQIRVKGRVVEQTYSWDTWLQTQGKF